jgi:hypothetical protein
MELPSERNRAANKGGPLLIELIIVPLREKSNYIIFLNYTKTAVSLISILTHP